jgi:flagellar protein FliO/FliZ
LPGAARTDRLAVIASLPVDARRRLVLVRRDDVEHLLLLEPAGTTVIETGIRAKDN